MTAENIVNDNLGRIATDTTVDTSTVVVTYDSTSEAETILRYDI